MELRYLPHLEVRLVHDKTYQKNKAYRSWTDKGYSSAVHKAVLVSFVFSFVIFSVLQSVFPFFNLGSPTSVQAGAHSKTWTTKGDFENNMGTTGTTTIRSGVSVGGVNPGDNVDITLANPDINFGTVSISAGDYHSLAVKTDGTLWAWGDNINGQLGIGNTTDQASPIQVGSGNNWKMVSAGGKSSLAIKTDGTLWAWGYNINGQLGLGNTTQRTSPVQVGAEANWKFISMGYSHSLAIKTDGTLWAWGSNHSGCLGLGDTTQRTSPVQVGIDNSWNVSSAGGTNSLAIKTDGTLWAWGKNFFGQLGIGNTTDQASPIQVGSEANWKFASLGHTHSLAIKTDGTLWAWGHNLSGQLGLGDTTQRTSPVQVEAEANWKIITAATYGTDGSSLAIKTDGTLWAWGYNLSGQLGLGDTTQRTSPVQVGAEANWKIVTAGGSLQIPKGTHSIAVKTSGSLWGWGSNNNGQLGLGDTTSRTLPTQIGALSTWRGVNVNYPSPGTISGLKIDAGLGQKAKWNNISWAGATPSNTSIKFRTRGAATEAGLSAATWSNYYTFSGSLITSVASQWLEVELRLETTDGLNTPTLNDFTLTYDTLESPTITPKKTDDSFLTEYSGTLWNNESSLNVVSGDITCDGCGTSDGRYIEAQASTDGTGFTNPISANGSVQGVGSPSVATISGLATGSAYHLRARSIDAQGRVSAWTVYDKTVTVDQSPPTGTLTIDQGEFTTQTTVGLTLSATDTGGSSPTKTDLKYRLSNNGQIWTDWTDYPANDTVSNWDLTLYGGSGVDGEKNVYVQYRDNAGNVSGTWLQTSDADFNAGIKTDVTVENNGVRIADYVDPYVAADWYDGRAGTTMEGKEVYNQNVAPVSVTGCNGTTCQWKTTQTDCVGPQCEIGLDPNHTTDYALVANNSDSNLFNDYPARKACQAVGGRLPYMNELSELYDGRATYGDNFGTGYFWPATEYSTANARYITFINGGAGGSNSKTNSRYVRCVRAVDSGNSDNYLNLGIFDSAIYDFGSEVASLSGVNFSTDVPANTAITIEARAGNTPTPDGTWTTYYTLTSGQNAPTELNNHLYLQYKATLTGDGNVTPTLYDISFEPANISASVTLDTQPPADVTNLRTYDSDQKSTQYTSGSWYADDTPYYEWDAVADADVAGYAYCTVSGCTPDPNGTNIIDKNTTNLTPTAYTTDGLKYFRVVAYDGAKNVSPVVAGFTYGFDNNLPERVTGLSASTNDNDKVVLGWHAFSGSPGSPAESYVLERIKYQYYNNNDADWANTLGGELEPLSYTTTGYAIFTLAGNVTSFNDEADVTKQDQVRVQRSVRYAYRIKVKDQAHSQFGPYQSIEVSGYTKDTNSPTDPSGVIAVSCDGTLDYCSEVGNKGFEIKLTWTKSDDFGVGMSHYNIYRTDKSNPAISDWQVIGVLDAREELGPIATAWYDNDTTNATTYGSVKPAATPALNDYTRYYYRVTAVDLNEPGLESPLVPADALKNHASAKTPDVTAPNAPSGVVATPMGPAPGLEMPEDPEEEPTIQRVLIAWSPSTDDKAKSADGANDGSGVKGYNVYRSHAEAGPFTELVAYTTETSINDDGLFGSTFYYYRVEALDNAPEPGASPATPNISALSSLAMAKTASNDYPTVPTNVTVTSEKGNPETNNQVGKKITVTFKGSYAKSCDINANLRCLVKYEVYRSKTNYATEAEWLSSATKLPEDKLAVERRNDRDTTYTVTDTNLDTATRYHYRVRAWDNHPADPDGGPFVSGLSPILASTTGSGWDITSDVTAPTVGAAGLEVKVNTTHPTSQKTRNIITWRNNNITATRAKLSYETEATCSAVSGDSSACNDFSRYEVYRQLLNSDGTVQSGEEATTMVASISAFDTNFYIDELDNQLDVVLVNSNMRYFVRVADSAGSKFKYPSGYPESSIINDGFDNKTAAHYSADSLIPNKATPSIVGSVSLTNVGVASAEISWATDQTTDAVVEYRKAGTNDPYIGTIRRTSRTSHSIIINSLQPKTEYQYRVISRNYLGNLAVKENPGVGNYSVLPRLETSGFNINFVSSSTTTTTAEVAWTTNIDASSAFIEYQMQRQGGDEAQSGTAGVALDDLNKSPKNHKVVIKGLRSDRAYTYKIKSISNDGFVAETSFLNFRTRSFDSAQFTLEPASSNVAERNITATTAQIIWQTATPTSSWVDYGTTSGKYDYSAGNDVMATQHVVVIEGLVPGTVYYYRVRVKDSSEVEFTSKEYSFRAVLKPRIENIRIKNITPYVVTIAWETNIDTETLINWGTSRNYGQKIGKPGLTKVHELEIENLKDDTEYHYQILAKDETGNEVADDDKIVRTPLDTEGPKIENVKVDILPLGAEEDSATAIISWSTNKPSTRRVQYDEGVISTGRYAKSTILDTSFNNSHTVIVRDLNPSATYRFRIVAEDQRGNETISNDYTIVTPSRERSILQIIVKSLEETFAWVKNVGGFFSGLGKKI